MNKIKTLSIAFAVMVAIISSLTSCDKKEITITKVSGITINIKKYTLIEGKTLTIVATVLPFDASNKTFKWKSSDTGVAEVDSTGKITAKKMGNATITATTEDGNKTATCEITVIKKIIGVSSISVNPTSKTLIEGEIFNVGVTVLPDNADNKSVKWTTNDVNVAEVDSTGKVTAKKSGNATITAITVDGNKAAPCKITVIKLANPNFILIPAGIFTMGSPANEAEREDDEAQYQVSLSAFCICKYQVTFAEYDAFCESTGRPKPVDEENWGRESRPVINVSWMDATEYCQWLSRKDGINYRLPTEAEWEYACRAGTTTPFSTGTCISDSEANYEWHFPYGSCTNTVISGLGKTIPVGSYPANPWGLFDMHGNVWEWCSNWFGNYPTTAVSDPIGPKEGEYRVRRGGSWNYYALHCRSAHRNYALPTYKSDDVGFRLVYTP